MVRQVLPRLLCGWCIALAILLAAEEGLRLAPGPPPVQACTGLQDRATDISPSGNHLGDHVQSLSPPFLSQVEEDCLVFLGGGRVHTGTFGFHNALPAVVERALGVLVLNLGVIRVDAQTDLPAPGLFDDQIHFTKEGQAAVGALIADALGGT